MILLPMGILVGFLIGLGEMDDNSGYFSLMLIVIYWWLVKLLPVLGNRILSLILAPPWSGQGDNTGYC
jgi:type III secretory pathway component EscS